MTIELQLFGGFSARTDGEHINGLRAAAPARLLAYLALNGDSRPRRVYLASQFWPDGSELRARRRLSHTLWVLQTALGSVAPSLIQADRDTIGLDPGADLWVDALEFEKQIDTFEARRREGTGHLHVDSLGYTVDLYRGDLLSDNYDDWVEPHRLRLREKYLLGLENLVELQKANRDYRSALVSARRLAAETPLSERAHLELIRLYWLAGRSDEAIAQYQACERILLDELGMAPGDELRSLRDRILAKRTPPERVHAEPAATDEAGLVGRHEARRRLLEVIDAALGGDGGFALVEGQTGMGKTRLLSDVAEAAGWRGTSVLWARHSGDHKREPYGGLLRALAPELTGLRREQVLDRLDPEFLPLATQLLPSLGDHETPAPIAGDIGSADERYRLHETLTQVVLAVAAVSPTVLIVDDLQNADDATLEFLRLAAPRIVRSRSAVLLSCRTQEARNREAVWQVLTDIEQRHRVTRVPLTGFSRDEIAALSHSRRQGQISDELIDRLERATGGNPLFVIETLRAVQRADGTSADLVIDAQLGGRATVQRVMDILLDEIANAPENVRAVVGALAVWGAAAPTRVITRLAGLETTAALDAIRHAIDADFVIEDGGSFMLRFEQLATAARSSLSETERRDLHRRAGDVLTEDPAAQASELAEHYRSAERWPEAARYETAAAARAASLHSYPTAAHYYELAIKSLDNAAEQPNAELLFGYESVLDTLGRREEQGDVLDRIQHQEVSGLDKSRYLQRRAAFLATTDNINDAIRVATSAVGFAVAAGLDTTTPTVALARVLVVAGRPAQAAAHLAGVATEGASATGVASVQLALGQAMTDTQDFDAGAELLASALRISRREGDSRGQVDALASMAVLLSQSGDPVAAERHYNEAIALARQIGSRFGEGMSLANLAVLHYMQGDAAAALGRMNEAAEVFMAIGHRRGEAMVRANSASIHHAILGDDGRAEREATAARRYFAEIGDGRHEAQCLDVLSGVRRRKRAHALSRKLAETALSAVRHTGDRWLEVQMLRTLARTEFEAGNLEESAAVVAEAVELCTDIGVKPELSVLQSFQARVMVELGDPAAGPTAMAAAADRGGAEFDHLGAWWRSEVFARLGDDAAAEAELELAHHLLADLLQPFGADERSRAFDKVAEHRAISEAYALRFPRTEVIVLPRVEDGEEVMDVELTVHHPDDLCINDKIERRHRRLLRILHEVDLAGASAGLSDLATALETSTSTLKRDLKTLRHEGLIL